MPIMEMYNKRYRSIFFLIDWKNIFTGTILYNVHTSIIYILLLIPRGGVGYDIYTMRQTHVAEGDMSLSDCIYVIYCGRVV